MTRRKYIKVDFGDVVQVYRKCSKCGEAYELSAGFYRSKAHRWGYVPVCKACTSPGGSHEEASVAKTYIRVDFEEVVEVYRPCTKCGEAHELSDGYHKHKVGRRGHQTICKSCTSPGRSHEEASSAQTYIRVDFEEVVEIYRACSKCGEAHELSAGFYRHKAKRCGHVGICKSCDSKDGLTWSRSNPEKVAAARDKYRSEHPEKAAAAGAAWKKANPDKVASNHANRRAAKLERTPFWVTKEHKRETATRYTEAQKLKEETGVEYHVDHTVPMQGEFVCGLHVPWNLQVITATENLQKSNKYTLWGDDD